MSLKQELYERCQAYIQERKFAVEMAIADAQEASGNETKSSAGDKYETSREMLQQEINMNLSRLSELLKLKSALDLIDPARQSPVVIPGSLVETDQGAFYIAISAGKLLINGKTLFAISAASPIGSLLLGKTQGSLFEFNGKKIRILSIG